MEGNSRDELVLLGRACGSTPAHGAVATGTSKDQAPDTAPDTDLSSELPAPWPETWLRFDASSTGQEQVLVSCTH